MKRVSGILLLFLALAACQPLNTETADDGRLRVLATTSIVGDVAAHVGGETISLTVLLEGGQDPHSYQASAQDLVAIQEADLILMNGFGLEETLIDSIENNAKGPVIIVSQGINAIEDGEHRTDPHVWMYPLLVKVWTQNIAAALSEGDSSHAATYAANAAAYDSDLEALDADILRVVMQIPEPARKLVTDHDSLSYFAAAYGFEVIGALVPGTSSTAGASAANLAALTNLVVSEQVDAIFVDATATAQLRDLADILGQETGRDIAVLTLYGGALAETGHQADSYIGMMRYNLTQIESALTP